MISNSGSICFSFPVLNGVRSGALLLAYRLICGFVEKGYDVKVIDYKSGLLKSLLDESEVKYSFVDLESEGWGCSILSNDVVFGFNNDIYTYPFIFENNPRLFFYDVYPPFWSNFLRPKGYVVEWLDSVVSSVYLKSSLFSSAIAVMEPVSVRMLQSRFPSVEFNSVPVVPVAVKVLPVEVKAYLGSKRSRITCIGRSELWKIRPLAKLIDDVLKCELASAVTLNLVLSDINIGVRMLERELGCKLSDTGLDIRLHENLESNEIEKIILEETDVGFAMGTSALEFARLKCPVLLADVSSNRFPDNYLYKWLYEVEPGCLGLDLDADINHLRLAEGVSLTTALEKLSSAYVEIANRCYEHVSYYHSLAGNVSKILSAVEGSCLRSNDIKALMPWVYFKAQELRRKFVWKGKYLERR